MLTGFRERFILTELHRDERNMKIMWFTFGVFILVLFVNITYLNLVLSSDKKSAYTINNEPQNPSIPPSISPSTSVSPSPSPASVLPPASINVQEPAVKEYFIPFGTGTNQTSDWADIPGSQTTIDFGSYNNIKEVHFETSVSVPTGNETVWVRLFNVSDKHPVWYSEVSTINSNLVISPAIIYDSGSKVYQVQMKTQLQYLANLVQARIHIILK